MDLPEKTPAHRVAYLKLLFIRHAQSQGNLNGQMEGQGSSALSLEGKQQANRLAKSLIRQARVSGELPTCLYTSPLRRASQTATAISQELADFDHPCENRSAPALAELHQGIFQGLTWAQAQDRYAPLCQQLTHCLEWQPVPGAESLAAARHRAEAWLTAIFRTHLPGEVLWVISHAGFLQQLISALMGCDRTWKIPIDHTGVFEFWLAANPDLWAAQTPRALSNRYNPEYWLLRRFNDTSHLQALENS